jgi:hypothetical protein
MLRTWIWPVYRGRNGPNSAASVPWEATFDAPSELFRQFQDELLRMILLRTRVNKGEEKGRGMEARPS